MLLQAFAVVAAAGAETVVGVLTFLLVRGLQTVLDGLNLCQLHADSLSVHQRVQGLFHPSRGVAAQA